MKQAGDTLQQASLYLHIEALGHQLAVMRGVSSAALPMIMSGATTVLSSADSAISNPINAGADFSEFFADLFGAPAQGEDSAAPRQGATEKIAKETGKEEDGERAAMASSFVNLPVLPVPIELRKLLPSPTGPAASATAAPKANAGDTQQQANGTNTPGTDMEFAFSLILQMRGAKQDPRSASSAPSGQDDDDVDAVTKKTSPEQFVAANALPRSVTPASEISVAAVGAPGSERHGSADQNESGPKQVLPIHSGANQRAPVYPFQETSGIQAGQQQPAPPIEKPHTTPPTVPEQSAPGQQKPVQNLQLQLGDGPHEPVQIQISERGGNIHVSVRSADPTLTEPLRQNLPGLVENLERRGYHAESVSTNDPQPGVVIHSEVKSQTGQNQSWYGSEQGDRRQGEQEAKGRRRRSSASDFNLSYSQIQENNA